VQIRLSATAMSLQASQLSGHGTVSASIAFVATNAVAAWSAQATNLSVQILYAAHHVLAATELGYEKVCRCLCKHRHCTYMALSAQATN